VTLSVGVTPLPRGAAARRRVFEAPPRGVASRACAGAAVHAAWPWPAAPAARLALLQRVVASQCRQQWWPSCGCLEPLRVHAVQLLLHRADECFVQRRRLARQAGHRGLHRGFDGGAGHAGAFGQAGLQ
jgi:hypothetical protein